MSARTRRMNFWLRELCRECCNRRDLLTDEELCFVTALFMATHVEPDELAILLGDLVPRIRAEAA